MDSYNELLKNADRNGIIVREKPLESHDGLICGNRIAIRANIPTQAEKACVLAEEIGHHCTTVGNILDQSDAYNRKQEAQARMWAYNNMVGLSGIISAHQAGCRNCHEMSEHLGVTERFLMDALAAYREKYGLCAGHKNYIVYFEPVLSVLEIKL